MKKIIDVSEYSRSMQNKSRRAGRRPASEEQQTFLKQLGVKAPPCSDKEAADLASKILNKKSRR